MGRVAEDSDGIIFGSVDERGRLYLTFILGCARRRHHIAGRLREVEAQLVSLGLYEYYSLVGSVEALRYAELFGFEGTKEMLNVNNSILEVVRKGL